MFWKNRGAKPTLNFKNSCAHVHKVLRKRLSCFFSELCFSHAACWSIQFRQTLRTIHLSPISSSTNWLLWGSVAIGFAHQKKQRHEGWAFQQSSGSCFWWNNFQESSCTCDRFMMSWNVLTWTKLMNKVLNCVVWTRFVSSWWFQPIWRICLSNWIIPQNRGKIGMKMQKMFETTTQIWV